MQGTTIKAAFILLAAVFTGACSSGSFDTAPAQAQPVDLADYAPDVDRFVVLLDTSGSMRQEKENTARYEIARNSVVNFNAAVPQYGFGAGLVIFGKGAGSCMGNGVARTIYGMTTYNGEDFLTALTDIDCVRSTTPIVSALDLTADMLSDEQGETAVIIFSDFQWPNRETVLDQVSQLRELNEGELCLHTVHVGDADADRELLDMLHADNSCGSRVSAAQLSDPAAMTGYVADVLMAPVAYEQFTLSAMTLFDFDKAVVKESGKPMLMNFAESIKTRGIRVRDIDIVGHTDSVGSQTYNAALSERRAKAVADFLVGTGVNNAIITTTGMGELDPIASNSSPNGRAHNRRVEILVGAAKKSQ